MPNAAVVASRLRATAAAAASGARSSTVSSRNPRPMITPTTSGSRETSACSRSRFSAAGPPTSALAGSLGPHGVDRRSELAAALTRRRHGGEEGTAAGSLRGRHGRDPGMALQGGCGARHVALVDDHLSRLGAPARRPAPRA